MAVSRAVSTGITACGLLLCCVALAEELTLTGLVAEPSETGATISYSTNLPASGTVEYGRTGAYEYGAIVDARLIKEHSVRLMGLAAGTRYHYRASAADTAGNRVDSTDRIFTTRSIDMTPPGIGNLAGIASDLRGTVTEETDEQTTDSAGWGLIVGIAALHPSSGRGSGRSRAP